LNNSTGNFRFIQAIGFLCKIMTVFLEGTSPATRAYSLELTDTALALQQLGFP